MTEPCDVCGAPAAVAPFVAQSPDAAHVCEDCGHESGEARYEVRQGEPLEAPVSPCEKCRLREARMLYEWGEAYSNEFSALRLAAWEHRWGRRRGGR